MRSSYRSYACDEWVVADDHAELLALREEMASLREQRPALSRTRSGRGYHKSAPYESAEVRFLLSVAFFPAML